MGFFRIRATVLLFILFGVGGECSPNGIPSAISYVAPSTTIGRRCLEMRDSRTNNLRLWCFRCLVLELWWLWGVLRQKG